MRLFRLFSLLFALAGAPALLAQAHSATASRQADLQVGGGVSYPDLDYGTGPKIGYSAYATLDLRTHFGVEVAFHHVSGDYSVAQTTYEIGGRYVRHYGRFNPYVRVMYGRGVMNFQHDVANLAYNIGAIGGGLDINVLRHVNVRADYEYQDWFSFPPHNLSPSMATVGAAYHF